MSEEEDEEEGRGGDEVKEEDGEIDGAEEEVDPVGMGGGTKEGRWDSDMEKEWRMARH